MKLRYLFLALAVPLATQAQTPVFTDNFGSGSTVNVATPVPPTATSTSYEIASTKGTTSSITAGDLKFQLNASTTSGLAEAQALFTTTPVALTATGQYIQLTASFTNTAGILTPPSGTSNGSYLAAGLFSTGGTAPNSGLNSSGLSTTATAGATGGTQGWQGFNSRLGAGASATSATAGTNFITTRSPQTGANTNNQELLLSNSGGGTYISPSGTAVGTQTAGGVNLTVGAKYTLTLRMTYDATATSLTIEQILYNGTGTAGAVLVDQIATATGANLLTTSFDGLAIGFRYTSATGDTTIPIIDFSSLSVTTGTVPEPSTWALMTVGGVAMLFGARRFCRA